VASQSHAPVISVNGEHRAEAFIAVFGKAHAKVVDGPNVFHHQDLGLNKVLINLTYKDKKLLKAGEKCPTDV
jgi:imidazole glycerol phosphate synthase subunit HisF